MRKTGQFRSFILLALITILSCTQSIGEPLQEHDSFVIWAHSDIQPRVEKEKSHYEKAVNDMAANFTGIDMALLAGDIVQFSHFNEIFRWFLDTRKKAPVHEWHEIAGNHDWRAIGLYTKYINEKLYYSVKKGNLLILMMSNEAPGRQTSISDQTFEWWKDLVINNQDRIIITVTHGALEGSGLAASNLDRLIVKNSGRFADVLKKYRMDIWISGHSHLPGWMPGMENINKELGNTVFIDLGAIREDFLTHSESRLIFFRQGSSTAIMKRRDHSSSGFISGDFIIPLSHPFTLK